MEDRTTFARTEKGRAELLGSSHALKQRQRQVLFVINEAISVGELRKKLPSCPELESILDTLWEDGYIGQVKSSGAASNGIDLSGALHLIGTSRLEAARQHALHVIADLAGVQSPAYAKLRDARDQAAFEGAVAGGRKLLAAVASAAQATAFEAGVMAILNLPASGQLPPAAANPNPARMNGIESAKLHALEIVRSLLGERSPITAKLNDAHNRADFAAAVAAGKKVIAAAASSAQAQRFETEVMARLDPH